VRTVSAPGLSCCVDSDQIVLVDTRRGCSFLLRGYEAAVWSWLLAGCSGAELQRLSAAYLRQTDEDALQSLSVLLESWVQAGILRQEEESRG